MTDFKHEVILCIVNNGFSDVVMDAAREFGAGGGGNAAPLRDRAEVFELTNGHEKAPPDELY